MLCSRRLKVSYVDIERLFKMSAHQRSQTTRQVCRRAEEETNVTKIYLRHYDASDDLPLL